MTLPNPFLTNSNISKPVTSIPVAVHREVNPGPGLPQSQISNYKYVPRPQLYHKFNNCNNYSTQYLPFSCDRCDRSFKTQELLDAHISEHIPCGINGCKFVAHPKIVEKHIMMQHETGLAEQIMRLNSPEEIQKWREQRKRNFPSAQNVARRQAEQKERMSRGEVIYEPNHRFGKGRKVGGNQKGKQGNKFKNKEKQLFNSSSKTESVEPSSKKKIVEDQEKRSYLSDGEIVSENEEGSKSITTGSSVNVLSSLIGCYASDSEDNITAGTSEPAAKVPRVSKENAEVPVAKYSKQSFERSNNSTLQKKAKKKNPKATLPANKYRPKQLTLLQKLLHGEIRHERNVILQCVHYIVQHGFFGIDNTVRDESQSSLNPSYIVQPVQQTEDEA